MASGRRGGSVFLFGLASNSLQNYAESKSLSNIITQFATAIDRELRKKWRQPSEYCMGAAMPELTPANPAPQTVEMPSWKCVDLNLETAQALVPDWSDLALNAIEKNVFYFPWYILPSLPLLEKKHAKIVTVYQADLLIGLFVIQSDFGYANLPIPFYRSAVHLHQFLGTPLVRAGFADQFATGLCAWLDDAAFEKSFLLLTHQTGDSEISRAIERSCNSQNRQLVELDRKQRAAITSNPNNSDEPEKHLSANRRKSLNRKLKNLITLGYVCVEKLSHEGEIDIWLEDFFAIENAGWKGTQETSILSSAQDTALYRDMVSAAFSNDCLNFFRMKLDGKSIAYTLDISCPPNTYCVKSSFDPAYKKYSPGILMEFETLKFYSQHREFGAVDSCSAADNAILNEMWPDRKTITSFAIARKGFGYSLLFRGSHAIKETVKSWLFAISKLRKTLPTKNPKN